MDICSVCEHSLKSHEVVRLHACKELVHARCWIEFSGVVPYGTVTCPFCGEAVDSADVVPRRKFTKHSERDRR